ncbi:C40 family peptidase [Arcobacter aquimarinus]|uniref:Outer membrane lipoprotein, NlpC/P60 family n=1 Tax=Arcobacter aquimarinus TaxID=1315211 RepID=A0AAE7B7B4_9BACT|nr:NlpC/P60 family protein [Arcobacter aquimarinus]MCB9097460.1 C40 family peptidase [Arcobacter sp.]QKE26975.1 outer membrane lipoprotein, NlpC/P60 family [Arcobacter aquimarinus]RXI36024.1 peptidase P60 [Arcobacter aquimarinus]
MIKKIFFIPTAVLLFSACSHNNQLAEKSTKDESLNKKQIILSYDEYKKQFDTKNQKVISKPLNTNSYLLSKQYESVLSNNKEEKNISNLTSQLPKKTQVFTDFYNEWKNVKYKMGGTSKSGIDCSAFTQKIYKEKFNISLPRTTITQVNVGTEVKKSELIPGDLVFFKTSKTDKHVGVYVGDNKFLHASIKGIQYTSLDKPFYKKNYWTSRRIMN